MQRIAWTLEPLCISAATLLTVLCFVAIQPVVPSVGLDPSWKYGIDDAAGQGLAFGRDVVFTFGPFASLYSDFRLPQHDAVYLVLDGLLAASVAVGFALVTAPRRSILLLALPLLAANAPVKDSVLLILPLALSLASCDPRSRAGLRATGLCLVTVASGLLPLVKGTMLVPVAGCLGLASLALLRDRSPMAAILPAVMLATMAIAWIAVGQDLANALAYVMNLSRVAAGYTDAMSLFGPKPELAAFAISLTVLAGAAAWATPQHGPIKAAAIVLVGFVAFKAGFVRHDGHAVIAAFFLAMLALLIAVESRRLPAAIGFLAGMTACAFVASAYMTITPAALWTRLDDHVRGAASAIKTRVTHPGEAYLPFDQAKADVRHQAGLPPLEGLIDIYPVDLAQVLASDLRWAPRPVLQSYSAYTPELAALNAHHLEGVGAPDHILFDVAPIDSRYPNLEDGASWPALLRHYDFQSFVGRFALLDRSSEDNQAAAGDAVLAGSYRFDEDISVPADVDTVWAQLRFRPSILGRLATFLFKQPLLSIDLTYASGRQAHYRFIAGMADGFLLSPTIISARDFVALMGGKADRLSANRVTSFRIHQESRFSPWGSGFDLTLSRFDAAPHAMPDDAFSSPPNLTPATPSSPHKQ